MSHIGDEIVGFNGKSWGTVIADEGSLWRLSSGGTAKKSAEDEEWCWAVGTEIVGISDGASWGHVSGDEGKVWRFRETGRIAKKWELGETWRWRPALKRGVGAEIISVDGEPWGEVTFDEGSVWRISHERVATKSAENEEWCWAVGSEISDLDGASWGKVCGDLGFAWKLITGRIARKENHRVRWQWLPKNSQFRWQYKAKGYKGRQMPWLEMGPLDVTALEEAFLSGAPGVTTRYFKRERSERFRDGDPETLRFESTFIAKDGVNGFCRCVEIPGRQWDERRVLCDVSLTECQKQALFHAWNRSREDSQAARQSLEKRLLLLTGEDTGWEQTYPLRIWLLSDAPFIVHVDFGKKVKNEDACIIDKFLNDDHYRSIFEVGHGGGNTDLEKRKKWEAAMFGDAYHPEIDVKDRPKYGTMNLTGDPRGVKTAKQYGTSYLVLKSDVRWRCTMTNLDSSRKDAVTASAAQVWRFLNAYEDKELMKIYYHSPESEPLKAYPEIQIHGPLKFNRDIAHIVADLNMDAPIQAKVNEFAQKNGIEVKWLDLKR